MIFTTGVIDVTDVQDTKHIFDFEHFIWTYYTAYCVLIPQPVTVRMFVTAVLQTDTTLV